jgi:alpha-glucosidase (family GH31 glycosyl hydrolase)
VSYDSPGGDQFLVDETNPLARATTFDKFWDGYGRLGIKTVWLDAAEPEVRASWEIGYGVGRGKTRTYGKCANGKT